MSPFQDQDRPAKRVCLGRIATAHGIRGLVKIHLYGDDPHLLDKKGPIYIAEDGDDTIALTMKNSMGKYWLASVEDVHDRNAAEELRGTELWLPRDKLPAIQDEDEFYYEDLVGMDTVDKSGKQTGEVASVQNFGAGDLLEIKPLSGPSFYIPFTRENVPEVNIGERKLVIVHDEEPDNRED